jgi:hypothetical protein
VPESPQEYQRPHWFTGQLVGPEDLSQWNTWALARKRRHNRLLHGWGLVFGADVTPAKTPQDVPVPGTVDVSSGFALSPQGDEIAIDGPVRVDVRNLPPVGPADFLDPDHRYFLAVRYTEIPGGVAPGGVGEPTRTSEGFALGLLDTLPEVYTAPPSTGTPGGHPAPVETAEPWVVLAGVKVTGVGGVALDEEHRRFVPQLRPAGPSPTTVTLTLAPNLAWMKDGFPSAWTHEEGRAVTRTENDLFSQTPGVGAVTSKGVMNVSLPEDSLISQLKCSGSKAPDRTLTITLGRRAIDPNGNGADGDLETIAQLRLNTQAGAGPSFFNEPAPAAPARARVRNAEFRYYVLAEATKTTNAANKLTGQAIINDFRIVYTP